jgi:geranylgeranyl diphosphate synthase, type II
MSKLALEAFLVEGRRRVDAALARYAPSPPRVPAVVADAMRYSLMAGGKRIRPLLALAAADAVASTTGLSPLDAIELALPVACAIEMIHTYSLIHDDLPAMDDDTLRRGRPTLHVVEGDGMAILAGDGLQAEAFHLLAREPDSPDPAIVARKLRVVAIVADAAGPAGMVGGQAIDLGAVRPGPGRQVTPLDLSTLEAMHARKTGALIRASATSGAVMAGASTDLVHAIARFAGEIGLAFQIVDDILDVEEGSDALGKTSGKDAAAGKPTYPALVGLDRSRELAAGCLSRAQHILEEARIADSHLAAVARAIVARRS